MYQSPLRNIKVHKEWMIVGHNSSGSQDPSPLPSRAIYSFQPRLKHVDFRRIRKQKFNSFDQSFAVNSNGRENEMFPKFPTRKTPMSVRSKRPTTENIDFLGTQLMFVTHKKNNRLYFFYFALTDQNNLVHTISKLVIHYNPTKIS